MSDSLQTMRLRCLEVKGRKEVDRFGCFFIRRRDAERFASWCDGTIAECVVTNRETIDYLLGPRHVPDALRWLLKQGAITVLDLDAEERAAMLRAFGIEPA